MCPEISLQRMLSRARRDNPMIHKDHRKAEKRWCPEGPQNYLTWELAVKELAPTGRRLGARKAYLGPFCLGSSSSMFKQQQLKAWGLHRCRPNLPIPSLLPFYSGEGKVQRKNFCFRLIYREASKFINSFDTTPFLPLLPTYPPHPSALLPKTCN